ncbi:MAG: alpha/beta fold hydrolase [Mariprofundaceae bacterium]
MNRHHHEKGFIDGPAGALQILHQTGKPDMPAIVVCHPHPQYGGTMRNKVVYWIARAFEDAGCSVLRFNFRGVEQSEGEWDEGMGEVQDTAAALDWLHARHPDAPLWLAGFSFGCYAGLQAARVDPRVERMFAVAPAVNLWSFDFMAGDERPLSVVSGTADEIVPFAAVQAWADEHADIQFHAIEGAGHFFPEHMQQMTSILLADAGLTDSPSSG